MTAGFVVGMASEARIARKLSPLVFAGGGRADLTRAGAQSLLAAGATALVSFGIAGALDPGLTTGDLILPMSVNGQAVDQRWHAELARSLAARSVAPIHGTDIAAASVAAKARLFQETGAVAVDMESHIAAEVARAAGVPFLIIRVIADRADTALPPAALVGLRPDGRPAIGAVLASLLPDPGQLPALIALARASSKALGRLDAAARELNIPPP